MHGESVMLAVKQRGSEYHFLKSLGINILDKRQYFIFQFRGILFYRQINFKIEHMFDIRKGTGVIKQI